MHTPTTSTSYNSQKRLTSTFIYDIHLSVKQAEPQCLPLMALHAGKAICAMPATVQCVLQGKCFFFFYHFAHSTLPPR